MAGYLNFALGGVVPRGEASLPVVVHAPGSVPDEVTVASLVAALGEGDVAVSVRPVTDTLKVVDHGQVVVGTADREHHRFVGAPFALRLGLLASVDLPADPVEALTTLAAHARLVPVD